MTTEISDHAVSYQAGHRELASTVVAALEALDKGRDRGAILRDVEMAYGTAIRDDTERVLEAAGR